MLTTFNLPVVRMGAAPGSGWEEGEFEFKLVFEEDQTRGPSPLRNADRDPSSVGERTERAPAHLETSSNAGQHILHWSFSDDDDDYSGGDVSVCVSDGGWGGEGG